jgi:hypothetical protein
MLKKFVADCLCGVGVLLITLSTIHYAQIAFACCLGGSTCKAVTNPITHKCDSKPTCTGFLVSCSCGEWASSPSDITGCSCGH